MPSFFEPIAALFLCLSCRYVGCHAIIAIFSRQLSHWPAPMPNIAPDATPMLGVFS